MSAESPLFGWGTRLQASYQVGTLGEPALPFVFVHAGAAAPRPSQLAGLGSPLEIGHPRRISNLSEYLNFRATPNGVSPFYFMGLTLFAVTIENLFGTIPLW